MDTAMEVAGRRVHRMGFGAMRIMGARDAAGRPDRQAAVDLVRRAVELGAQFIDTADIYGDGASEKIIAEALHPYPEGVLVATKGGFVPGQLQPGQPALPADCRPERLRQVCEDSLRRLRVDRIDLYQLHTPDAAVPFEDSIGALVDLRREGKIDHIGLSNVERRTPSRLTGSRADARCLGAEPLQPSRPHVGEGPPVLRGTGHRVPPVGTAADRR